MDERIIQMLQSARPENRVRYAMQAVAMTLIKSRIMFTASDINHIMRVWGASDEHGSMRHPAHELFEQAAMVRYKRTLFTPRGSENGDAPKEVWVYHPVGEDAAAYKPIPDADVNEIASAIGPVPSFLKT